MDLMKYSKAFALAAFFALVAGCGGATMDDVSEDIVSQSEIERADAALSEGIDGASDAAARAIGDATLPNVRVIYFDFDKSNIRSEFYDVLNLHAAYLMANPRARVVLEGHTDERGTREYNMALGERRGNSVQRYLSLQGVSSSQMEVVSYGEERPAVRAAQSREDHAQNRRVVFVYR
ncbi:peptidoglycan-associated lipoprotein Pal [Marinospirillum alkaliphilum]|uniref:Peptidoglycan-associated lipoprotein n=1 Tax=Marinospirillum alkaliphilum DSM 21637 TaxID=1122209 RepID=A0A1K1XIS6_9GAMM|nr:peptidoglycan-associated lipoprotein Pal [Marinospirillum alkaliphilum]SFX49462.1 peptidoglycan-associated lipoprotein [Marinospirillum alkaliphilum DSM 21637]